VQETSYTYNSKKLLCSETIKNSDGKEYMKRYKYVGDYESVTTDLDGLIISTMKNKNRTGCLAEEQTLIKKDGNWNLWNGKLTKCSNCYL
jgi:hypothetical protein